MPQDVSVEYVMAELVFRYEVDQGLKQLDEGKGIPHEEVEKRMKNGKKIGWSPKTSDQFEDICKFIGKDSEYYAYMFAKKLLMKIARCC